MSLDERRQVWMIGGNAGIDNGDNDRFYIMHCRGILPPGLAQINLAVRIFIRCHSVYRNDRRHIYRRYADWRHIYRRHADWRHADWSRRHANWNIAWVCDGRLRRDKARRRFGRRIGNRHQVIMLQIARRQRRRGERQDTHQGQKAKYFLQLFFLIAWRHKNQQYALFSYESRRADIGFGDYLKCREFSGVAFLFCFARATTVYRQKRNCKHWAFCPLVSFSQREFRYTFFEIST